MSILNVTPVEGLVGNTSIPRGVQTDQAVNISSDSTGTAIPTLFNGDAAEFLMLVADAAMYIKTGTTQGHAAGVAVGDTLLPANTIFILSLNGGITHIAKKDK